MKKNEPIRVLQCVSNMDRAGIETMLMNFYRNIDRNKIQFDFLVNKSKPGDYDDEIKTLGGNIYKTPGLNPFKQKEYQKYMDELFKNHSEYRIIHCQNEAMGYYALKAAKRNNIPVRISHSHNTTTRLDYKYPIKIYCKKHLKKVANIFVACSHAAGKYLFNEDVKVINNAIDTKKFIFDKEIRTKLRKELDLENKFVIGHVGRFEPQKNHKFLIDIFEKYYKINNNSVLLLIGNGSLEAEIKNKVKLLGLEKNILFIGNIPNVNKMYQVMDLFLLPSLHEGLPVVGVEAQTAGLPCIIADTVTPEIKITDNVEFISLNKSTDYWAERINGYIQFDRKNMQQKVERAGYDIKVQTQKLSDWYLKLYNGE